MPAPTAHLRVAAVQERPAPRGLARNLERVAELVRAADADLVVFPELFLSGYQTTELEPLAIPTRDARLEPLAAACRETRTALLVGFVEPGDDGWYDAFLAIDRDGTILPAIRKTHLFGGERDVFLRGDRLEPVALCGVPVGVVNCFELEFPEVARTLAVRGAALLVAGSANMHPYTRDHRVAATARALENRLPLAYANRIGAESGHAFCGGSVIVAPDGEILAELGSEEPGLIAATLAVGGERDAVTDMLAQRRPELYER